MDNRLQSPDLALITFPSTLKNDVESGSALITYITGTVICSSDFKQSCFTIPKIVVSLNIFVPTNHSFMRYFSEFFLHLYIIKYFCDKLEGKTGTVQVKYVRLSNNFHSM